MPDFDPRYDEAYGPTAPPRRRPTAEWLDPYESIDARVSARPEPPGRARVPGTGARAVAEPVTIPKLAELRRDGTSMNLLCELAGWVAQSTMRAWFADAGFDRWGWRQNMACKCATCGTEFSPWQLRQVAGGNARWPSRYCSKVCSES